MERYLKVRVYAARDLRDFHSFSRPHPFCKISVSGEKVKTCVSEDGHRSPVWDEEFVFRDVDPQQDQIVIKVKDKSHSSKKLIGECRLPVSLFVNGNAVDQWYPLSYDSEPVGEINLRVHLKEKYEMQPVTMVTPATVVAPAYPPQPQPYYQQPPPPAYGYQAPPPQYGYQQPPPPAVAYTAGPPVMVVEERRHGYGSPGCSPRGYDRRDYGSPRRYDNESRGFSGAQMAMGVGAGMLGGVVLGEMVDRVFDDDDD